VAITDRLACRKKVVSAKRKIKLGRVLFLFIFPSYLFGQWCKHETSDSQSPRPRNNLRWLCRRMKNSCPVNCQSPNTENIHTTIWHKWMIVFVDETIYAPVLNLDYITNFNLLPTSHYLPITHAPTILTLWKHDLVLT